MMSTIKIDILWISLLISVSVQAQVVNGDFSQSILGDCNAGQSWDFSSPKFPEVSAHFDNISDHCLDLTPCGAFGNGTWISQRVHTTTGQWYQLAIDLATLCGWDVSDAGVSIYIDGRRLCRRVYNGEFTCKADSLNWRHKLSDYFQAVSDTTLIRIEGFSYCSGFNSTCPKGTIGFPGFIGVDNVALVPVTRPTGKKIVQTLHLCTPLVLDIRGYLKPFDTYRWSTGESDDTLLVSTTGQYTAIITDSCRILISDTIVYKVLGCDSILVDSIALPTAFTPNGDGSNDQYYISYQGYPTLQYLYIYNRWGQRVYESTSLLDRWDGSYQGEPAPNEVYHYQVGYLDQRQLVHYRSGSFALIR
jgi:gliding motility-associated-like protein